MEWTQNATTTLLIGTPGIVRHDVKHM